jgi:hypothetical protein
MLRVSDPQTTFWVWGAKNRIRGSTWGFAPHPPADADPAAQVAHVQPRRPPVSPSTIKRGLRVFWGRQAAARFEGIRRRIAAGWPVGAIRKAPAQTHDPIFAPHTRIE